MRILVEDCLGKVCANFDEIEMFKKDKKKGKEEAREKSQTSAIFTR